MNRLKEIEKRLAQIPGLLEQEGADLEALEAEVMKLKEERQAIKEKIETRKNIIAEVDAANSIVVDFGKEERTNKGIDFEKMNREEVLATPEYRSAFLKRLQGKKLNEVEERAYGTVSTVGTAIPTQTANELFDKMVTIAPLLEEITLLRVSGNVKFSMENARADAALHTENAAVTPATDTFTSVSLGAYELIKVIRISKTVQTMSINAFEGWIVDILSEDLAEAIENYILNGTGASQPKGVNVARTWTNGTTGIDYGTGITYNNVVDLIALLPARHDAKAKFVMNKTMFFGGIMKIKDTAGNPIFIRDTEGGSKYKVLGYPVLISDKVAAGAAFLGNFKKVVGNLAQDTQVEASEASAFLANAIDYKGTAMFDCDIAEPEAFVKLFT